jgi:TonB family protein
MKILKFNLFIASLIFVFSSLAFTQQKEIKVLKYEVPKYPPAARAVRATGTVVVKVQLDSEGKVISALAESGHALLKKTSEISAKNWVFRLNKNAFESEFRINFVFKIKSNNNPKNNYKETTYKSKFVKPLSIELTAKIYPQIDYVY